MKMRTGCFSVVVLAFAALPMLLGACGGDTQESPPKAGTEKAVPAGIPPSVGTDLSGVNACALIPVPEVEAVIGKLRYNPPKQTTSIDREKGCNYIDSRNGHFYEVTFYPLDHWGLVKVTLKDPKPLKDVGDGAYVSTYSDSLELQVLVKDRLVIGVRVSDKNLEHALALYRIALKHLP